MVGTLDPRDVGYLAEQLNQPPATADVVIGTVAVRVADRVDGLSPAALEQLPELLRQAVAVMHDPKSSALLYLVPDPGRQGSMLAIEVGVGRASGGKVGNLVKAVRRATLSELLGQLASAALQLVRGSLG
jgi:hypothetical protein